MTTFTSDDVNKLKQLVNEGIQVKGEMEALREGLKDTVTAIAEELDIKPAVLNKAISIAYKAEFSRAKDDFDELETILETVGRTL
jgi:hypothetical protein|tara:strand:- start:5000 stop:5254 length:255 start_codon:yes stop_codon:yes gene_type:complete